MSLELTQTGHLSDLQLERIFAGEILSAHLMAHLETCEICQARLEAIRVHDESVEISAPKVTRPRFVPYGTLMAAAAALLIYVYSGDEDKTSQTQFVAMEPTGGSLTSQDPLEGPDTFRVKGGLNALFMVKRGEAAVSLKDGDTVFPGDVINFEAASPQVGYLMVAAVDGAGEPYLCYPQDNGNQAGAFGPVQAMTALHPAMRLDGILGPENMYAIFCDKPFDYASVASRIRALHKSSDNTAFSLPKTKCQVRSVRLTKKQRAAP